MSGETPSSNPTPLEAKPNRRQALRLLSALALGVGSSGLSQPRQGLQGLQATIYKDPNCSCCSGYVDFLKAQGVRTTVVIPPDLSAIKARYQIPAQAQSCHTTWMGGYVVEGHVPLLALQKLFRDRPRIDGIALGGMPTGTPGMPGSKTGPYRVVSLNQGRAEPFLTL